MSSFERGANVRGRDLDTDAWLPGRLEEHEPGRAGDDLLVARERRPRRVAIDPHRLRPKRLLDDVRVEAGEPQRREQAERDGAAVRERVVRRRLERVRERVAEVQLRALAAVVRVAQAEGGLERRRAAHLLAERQLPDRLAGEQAGLDDLGTPVRGLLRREASPAWRDRSPSAPANGRQPTRFFPSGRSIAVLPPIAASTWPTSVVGTATQSIPRKYVAAAKPATSVVHPPPSATSVPERSSRSACQSASSDSTVFACSPGASSWTARARAPSASWTSIP